jgi:hypothetical protein
MSGYLTRLAARASGRDLGPVLAPRFPPAIPAVVRFNDASLEPPIQNELLAGPSKQAEPARQPKAEPPTAPAVAAPATEAAAEAEMPVPEPTALTALPTGRPKTPPIAELAQIAAPQPAEPPMSIPAVAAEVRVGHVAIPNPPPAEPATAAARSPSGRNEPKQPALVKLVPRPVLASTLPTARRHTHWAAQPSQPRIQVHIGRVEVRPPGAAVQREIRPTPAAAPASRPDPFARLAAARRYVDRAWP